jgi:hypothetical protein
MVISSGCSLGYYSYWEERVITLPSTVHRIVVDLNYLQYNDKYSTQRTRKTKKDYGASLV